jgi:hypothetical protein
LDNTAKPRRDPVASKTRERELLVELSHDPIAVLNRRTLVRLAEVEAQLELDKPGSLKRQRLLQERAQHKADLIVAPPAPRDDLDNLTEEALAERLEAAAAHMRDVVNAKRADAIAARPAASASSDVAAPAVAPAQRDSDARCAYCQQPVADCARMQSEHLSTWQTLHFDDPSEIERRGKAYHDEMMESLRRQARGIEPPQW